MAANTLVELYGHLEQAALGNLGEEAALGLLIVHGHWLRHRDFVESCVWVGANPHRSGWWASIAWGTAVDPTGPCRTADPDAAAVLYFAAHLAGERIDPSPGQLMAAMVPTSRRMAHQATRWAGGLSVAPPLDGPVAARRGARKVRWPVTGTRLPTVCLDCLHAIPDPYYHPHVQRCVRGGHPTENRTRPQDGPNEGVDP